MKEIKIGIDLSTKKIGLAICKKKTVIYNEQLVLQDFSQENLYENYKKISDKIQSLHKLIYQISDEIVPQFTVGIELSNFVNPKLTGRFNIYAGFFISCFYQVFHNCEIKMFNSNEWQKIIGCKSSDKREARKLIAKQWVLKNHPYVCGDLSEDEYDAICIALVLEKLHTTEQSKDRVIAEKKSKLKIKSQIAALEKLKITRLNKIIRLDNKRNKVMIRNIKSEIAMIDLDIIKLKKGGKFE